MARSLELKLGLALATVTNHQAQIDMHTKLLTRSVLAARAKGATWQQVADALGVTQQSVSERFGPAELEKASRAKPVIAKGQGSLAL